MKKSVLVHTTLCIAATVAISTSQVKSSDAVSFTSETNVAGIEFSLDGSNINDILGQVSESDVVSIMSTTMAEGSEVLPEIVPDQTNQEVTEVATETDQQTTEVKEEEKVAKEEPVKEEPVSEYANVGISIAPTYVNVRAHANTDSEVVGKLYKGSAATILDRNKEWVKIQSGNVKGYINAEYLAIGFDAEELVEKYGTKYATVNTTTLKVREKTNTDSTVLTLIPLGESYEVIKENDEWVKVIIDEATEEDPDSGIVGFVSKEFVDITVKFPEAISIEEEQAKLKAEEEAKKAEAEQLEKLRQEREQQNQSNSNSSNSNSSSSSNNNNNSSSSNNSSNSNNNSSSSNGSNVGESTNYGSGTGSDIAAFAQKFVGNPYVYGGTSLTNGTDCSGFTQSVYASFGYSIPRTSSSQAGGAGSEVSLSSLQPGDLVFYSGGSGVNHVAIYIGGGKVVHASNPKSGIKISSVNYRTPCKARRVAN